MIGYAVAIAWPQRAEQTGRIIGEDHHIPFGGTEPRLVEIDWGEAEGQPVEEMEARYPGRSFPGREDHQAVADRGYDADWFRDALQAKGIQPCIPGRRSRNEPVKYDKRRYRRRSRIEIMFGRLKDWRRVATRYDRCPTAFFSAIALAATVIFWL